MGVAEVLCLIFIVLKLTGVITWSWWLVFIPIIISWTAILTCIVFASLAHSRQRRHYRAQRLMFE